MNNPKYVDRIPKRIENIKIALQNDKEMLGLLDSSGCHAQPHQCLPSLKIFKFKEEVNYVHGIFENICHRFLAAIDHLEYHHSSPTNETRHKCDLPDNYSQNTVINDGIPIEEQNEVVLDLL